MFFFPNNVQDIGVEFVYFNSGFVQYFT